LSNYLPTDFTSLTHRQQAVSADGSRVFFESHEPLVPADTNGELDAYEWERQGTGSCEAGSLLTGGGCVYLLGAAGGEASLLIAADEAGNNAFVISRSRLVSTDSDEKPDLYDVRVEGGFPLTAKVFPCEGNSCQGPATPSPGVSSPASSAFSGPGNAAGKRGCPPKGGAKACHKKHGKHHHKTKRHRSSHKKGGHK
jgi:hypothetical protein